MVLTVQTDATSARASSRVISRIRGAYATSSADGLAAFSASTGLTASGATLSASVPGVTGDGIVPLFAKQARASFRVKCIKATADSRSSVGVSNAAPGVPTGDGFTFGFGYRQGVGLGFIRDGMSDVVAIADASITDGDEYDVTLIFDNDMGPAAGKASPAGSLDARWRKVGTKTDGRLEQSIICEYYPVIGNIAVRTNATDGISNLSVSTPLTGPLSGAVMPSTAVLSYDAGGAPDDVMIHVPATPNGMAVIACHGHGSSYYDEGWLSETKRAVWDALCAKGYTVFVPDMRGNLWGNNTAQAALTALHGHIEGTFGLDPAVFLWGDSMGGGAALTAVAQRNFPIRAAYVTEPVCDLALLWSDPSFPTLSAAYGASTAARDANNPMAQPASAFAGVPIAFCASAADTIILKAGHTDAMRTKLAGVTETVLFTATGAHAAPAAYRPIDPVAWFAAHI